MEESPKEAGDGGWGAVRGGDQSGAGGRHLRRRGGCRPTKSVQVMGGEGFY